MLRRKYWHCILLCALVAVISGLCYASFISHKLYQENMLHLKEIYSGVNQSFSMLAVTNWNMLMDWDEYLVYGLDDLQTARLDKYFQADKTRWGYTEVYFLNEAGDYMTLNGRRGQFQCRSQLQQVLQNQQNSVFDVHSSDGSLLTLFTIPAAKNSYHGFSYCAIAAGYSNKAINDALNVSAFDGKSHCYMVYSDGRIILSTDKSRPPFVNFLSELADHSDLNQGSLHHLSRDFAEKEEGILQYHMDGVSYYMIYQPAEFQDWMLVGTVPKAAVTTNVPQLQIVTIIVLSAISLAIVLIGMAFLVRRNKATLAAKNAELQFQEELFTILMQNFQDIFLLYSRDRRSADYISPNVEKLLGISTDYIEGDLQKLNSCAVQSGQSLIGRDLSDITEKGILYADSEWINCKSGEHRWYHETLYHVTLHDEKRLLLVLSDRTSEWHNHQQLELALDIACSANEAKSSFLSNMSHDIRTPMNAISGFASLLEQCSDDPGRVRDYSGKILTASHHLLGLINDVLDMSKIESGNTALNITEFNLDALIDELRSMITPLASSHRQSFTIQMENIYCRLLWGDPLRISQVLLNLLSNSVKYTPEGGNICLTIRMGSITARGRIPLVFEVEDDGVGIEPDFLHSIFEPFTRETGKIQNEVQGTGLGMAITKNLVELMGGHISVESTPDVGSLFTVELELRANEKTAAEIPKPAVVENLPENPLSGFHLLVAEDNIFNAEIIEDLLMLKGATCEIANNGREAVNIFLNTAPGHFSAILMDVQMPDMDGYQATRMIRKSDHPEAKSITIIAITANAFTEDVQAALNAGMNAHVPKPIDMNLLCSLLLPESRLSVASRVGQTAAPPAGK